jgi:phage gp29-like protein
MSKADRDALWNAVNNFGNLFRGMIPNTAELDTLSDANKGSTGSGGGVFDTYIGYWDDSLAIRVLGEAMTTDTSQSGSYAKAKTGREVSQDKKFADRILLQSAFNGLIKKLIDINYAGVKEYPKWQWKEEEETELQNSKADILVKLKQAGFQIDEAEASEIFEMVLSRVSAPPPGFNEKFAERKVIDKYIQEMFNQLNGV